MAHELWCPHCGQWVGLWGMCPPRSSKSPPHSPLHTWAACPTEGTSDTGSDVHARPHTQRAACQCTRSGRVPPGRGLGLEGRRRLVTARRSVPLNLGPCPESNHFRDSQNLYAKAQVYMNMQRGPCPPHPPPAPQGTGLGAEGPASQARVGGRGTRHSR